MKTFVLNKDAKMVIGIMEEISKKRGINAERKIRFKEITHWKTRPYDESVRRGLKILVDLKIILREGKNKPEIRYQINPRYLWQGFKIGRQNSDIAELQSFPFKDVINLNTTKGKTTIYGLPEEIFHKSDFKSRTFDYDQKETLDFVGGIRARDILGKYFGVPFEVKIKSNLRTSEKEIAEKEVEYYLNLIKKGIKPEEIIRKIITKYRDNKIQFKELGENISNYLIELKREYRRKVLLKTYNQNLKELSRGKLKSNLARLKQGFVGILAQTDHDKHFLKRSIFESCGEGVGGYDYNKNPKLFWSFHKFVNSLSFEEEEVLFDFLWEIFEENRELYPTNIAFICRGHSVDIFPEGIPRN